MNKGSGPDEITPAILKLLASVVKVPLKFDVNLSLPAGVWSAIWKEVICCSFIQERRYAGCFLLPWNIDLVGHSKNIRKWYAM
jgi:hypothetical protein